MIIKNSSKLILELGIDPKTVKQYGTAFTGRSESAAYAWQNGEIHEIVAGSIVTFPSISANDVERITGLTFAGKPENTTVFMSSSSTLHVALPDHRAEIALPDTSELTSVARIYCQHMSDLAATFSHVTESISAAARQWFKYDGKKITIDDANDEYDLELSKGDLISVTYLNRDRYELIEKESPRIKFIVRGHLRVMNIIGQSIPPKPFGIVAADKTNTFAPVGVVQRRMAQPIQLQKGDVIYSYRKKHYLAQNLAVPLEKFLSTSDLDKVLSATKIESNPKAIAKGKLVGVSLPALENATKVKTPASSKKVATQVYGAYFPVSLNTPNRSRIVFGSDIASLQTEVRSIISTYRNPVDYRLFTTLSSDELADLGKSKAVIIRATGLLDSKYKQGSQLVEMGQKNLDKTQYPEPLTDAPPFQVPAYGGNEKTVADAIRRLILEGYFVTGLMLDTTQPTDAVRFRAENMDDATYDRVVGATRRIFAYMRRAGAPLTRANIKIARGKKVAEIRFKLPTLSPEGHKSIDLFRTDFPRFNTPIYKTIKPIQPTVEIIAVDIHTGKVTVRAQRGPELYGSPYETYYSNVQRKDFTE